MRKNNIIFILIPIIIFISITAFLYSNRKITIKESSIKNIFSLESTENIDIIFTGVLGNELGRIDDINLKNEFLSIIKDEKIKPTTINDYTSFGDAYRIIIKYNGKEYKLVIGYEIIGINRKQYKTDNNIYLKLYGIFNN